MTLWRTTTIQDLASSDKSALSTGPFGSAVASKNFRPSGVPMLRGSNLSDDVGTKLDERDLVFLDPDLAATFGRSTARKGDLVFTCWGSVGQIGLIDADAKYYEYVVSNKQMKLSPDPKQVDSLFLYYNMSQPKMIFEVQSRAIGSTIPGFNLGQLRALEVEIPDLAEQGAIVEVLGALDDKIAANTKLATTAMSLAEMYFRRTMRLAIEERALDDILSLEYGKSLPATSRVAGPVDVYGSGGIAGSHTEALCHNPGVIVGRKGTAGAVHWSHRAFFPIDTTFYVVPRHHAVSQAFSFFLLRTLGLDEMNNDSAVPGLNRNQAHASRIRLPSDLALNEFTAIATELFDISAHVERQNSTLVSTRDALLPQLMSGKLRVKDPEKVLAVAGV